MLKWLELTPDYQCNNRCLGCFSVQEEGALAGEMGMAETLQNLALGRRQGASGVWIGGGEPTLRRDLPAVAAAARRLGFERVKIQTNGMLLAYPDFTRRLVEAGVTEVNVSLKGSGPELHDRLTRTPGCHRALVGGIAQAKAQGLAVEGDVLLYRENVADLPEMVRTYHALGVERFHLWLLSAFGAKDPAVAASVPRIDELMPFVVAAMDLRLSDRPDFVTSLHTPPCTVPATHHAALFFAPDLGLLVTNPGGFRFPLETSPIEGGTWFDRCASCRHRPRCGGARADYVAIHGETEFQPIP